MYFGSLGQISNHATWENGFDVIDAETDDFMDLTGATITMRVARSARANIILTASTDNGGIVIPALGQFNFRFEESQMNALCGGTYAVSIRIERSGDVDQLFLGDVAILEGF